MSFKSSDFYKKREGILKHVMECEKAGENNSAGVQEEIERYINMSDSELLAYGGHIMDAEKHLVGTGGAVEVNRFMMLIRDRQHGYKLYDRIQNLAAAVNAAAEIQNNQAIDKPPTK